MRSASPRYAIYFTPPPSSPLAVFGAAVIGYDSSGKAEVPHLALNGIPPAELVAATEAPRRYGFHATLVAPFHLKGTAEADLLHAFGRFCNQCRPADLGRLKIAALGNFVALIPFTESSQVDGLSRSCVEFFDSVRNPLNAEDLARRNNGRLSARQKANLDRWGYPYVFEDFRFHMTLTGGLAATDLPRFLAALGEHYASLAENLCDIDALSLMRQSDSDGKFEVIARRSLQGDATSQN